MRTAVVFVTMVLWAAVCSAASPFDGKWTGTNGTVLFVYVGKITGDQIEFGRRPDDLTVGLLVKGTATRSK